MASNLSYKVIERDASSSSAREIDRYIKNKWVWDWLTEKDVNGNFLSDYIKKIDQPGLAICIWCKDTICYGSSGKKRLFSHAKLKKEKHLKNKDSIAQNTTIPSSWIDPNKISKPSDKCSKPCDLPYGVACNVHDSQTCSSKRTPAGRPIVSVDDRKSNAEAFILSFTVENSIPLSKVQKLVEFAQFLARDTKALNHIKMDRTAASYKLTEGLSYHNHAFLIEKLRKSFFSINMDECTSTSNKRVFSILVSYFDESRGESVIEHYESIECFVVNAKFLFEEICRLFSRDEIPWKNLVSDLSDSANYMRGKKSGLETRLREQVPHLLDIDGDLCHHVHNSVKKFCTPFDNFAERLLDDLHNDSKYSTDIRQAIEEICLIIGVLYKKPSQRISHRWLSAYDCTVTMMSMIDAFFLFYFTWLEPELKKVYYDEINEILTKYHVNETGKLKIKEIQRQFKSKSLTDDGKARKKRIFNKIIIKQKSLLLISNCYTTILPLFKSLILVFQQKEPQIHKLHDMMVNNFRTFLASFMKFEVIKNLSSKKLKKIDIASNIREPRTFFLGDSNQQLISKMLKNRSDTVLVKEFFKQISDAFVQSATYIQKKYAIDNELLISLSGLDPIIRGHTKTHSTLLKLLPFFKFSLSNDSSDSNVTSELVHYQLDEELPEYRKGETVDAWWNTVFESGKYPCLSKIVKASLSIFSGPHIESSFSVMNDLIDKKSNRMNVSTYSAIMNVKYSLKAESKTSFQKYNRKDTLHHPVNSVLAYNMRTSRSRYVKRLTVSREQRLAKQRSYGKNSSVPEKKRKQKKKAAVHTIAAEISSKIIENCELLVGGTKKDKRVTEEQSSNKLSVHDNIDLDIVATSAPFNSGSNDSLKRPGPSNDTLSSIKPKKMKQISLTSFFKK